jgi:uncharacterized protein YggE
MKKLLTVLGMLLVSPAWAEVTVTGEGKATATPDTVFVTVGVETTAKTAHDALAANNGAMTKLFQTLEKFGIKKEHIQTSGLSVQPQYDYKKEYEGGYKLIGYSVNNTVTVCSYDLDKVGELLDAVVRDGANRLSGIRFALKDTQKVMDEARTLAMKDAMRRAQLYADVGGFKLGSILTVSESQRIIQPRTLYAAAAPSARAESAAVPVSAGELSFSFTVNVVYDIAGSEMSKRKPRRKK